jgi:hypothetical protein
MFDLVAPTESRFRLNQRIVNVTYGVERLGGRGDVCAHFGEPEGTTGCTYSRGAPGQRVSAVVLSAVRQRGRVT